MIERNDARYLRLSEPFDNVNEADDAVQAFYKDVAAAREKHGIPDIVVLVELNVKRGEVTKASSTFSMGNYLNRLPMLARAYGAEREAYEQTLGATIEEGRRSARGGR